MAIAEVSGLSTGLVRYLKSLDFAHQMDPAETVFTISRGGRKLLRPVDLVLFPERVEPFFSLQPDANRGGAAVPEGMPGSAYFRHGHLGELLDASERSLALLREAFGSERAARRVPRPWMVSEPVNFLRFLSAAKSDLETFERLFPRGQVATVALGFEGLVPALGKLPWQPQLMGAVNSVEALAQFLNPRIMMARLALSTLPEATDEQRVLWYFYAVSQVGIVPEGITPLVEMSLDEAEVYWGAEERPAGAGDDLGDENVRKSGL